MSEKKYIKIIDWLRKRYTNNGRLIIDVGGKPTKYKRLEALAWCKYMLKGYRWMELTDGSWELCSISQSGLIYPDVSEEDLNCLRLPSLLKNEGGEA